MDVALEIGWEAKGGGVWTLRCTARHASIEMNAPAHNNLPAGPGAATGKGQEAACRAGGHPRSHLLQGAGRHRGGSRGAKTSHGACPRAGPGGGHLRRRLVGLGRVISCKDGVGHAAPHLGI